MTWSQIAYDSYRARGNSQTRIVGGILADAQLGPFMVELAKIRNNFHLCGGSSDNQTNNSNGNPLLYA